MLAAAAGHLPVPGRCSSSTCRRSSPASSPQRLDRLSPLARGRGRRRQPAACPAPSTSPPATTTSSSARARAARHTGLTQGPPENFCRPAVDVLFRSAVAAYGGAVLGVVLTGMGSDGRSGAGEIRDAGGTVLVQDQATSVVWGMPGAVAQAGLADEVLPLDRIAEAITRRLAGGPPSAQPAPGRAEAPDDPHRHQLRLGARSSCTRRARSCSQPGKEYLVEARLLPIARAAGHRRRRRSSSSRSAPGPTPASTRQIVEALTTNETSWFRDGDPFTALTATVLPALLAARGPNERLQIWSAACSSGQEPYTIAMLLEDALPQRRLRGSRSPRPTCPREMVERTRAGRFSQLEVNRGLPAPDARPALHARRQRVGGRRRRCAGW